MAGRVQVPAAVEDALGRAAARQGFVRPRFLVEKGSSTGDGFMSVVYRATIHEQDPSVHRNEFSVVCKMTIPGNQKTALANWAFTAEGCMYEAVLPALTDVANLIEPLPWPRCLDVAVAGPPPWCLVLGDLRPQGYVMAARACGLSAGQCRYAASALARLHGAGMALERLRPDIFRAAVERMGGEHPVMPEDVRASFSPFLKALKNAPDMITDKFPKGSVVHEVLSKMFASFNDDYYNYFDADPEGGNCFIHGDCQANNVLFQYDKVSGAVSDCRLLDFQLSRYGNPAPDVCLLLLACTEKAVRDEVWQDLQRQYHSELQATLLAAGIEDPDQVYSWQRFQAQMQRGSRYAACCLPMIVYMLTGGDESAVAIEETLRTQSNGDVNHKATSTFVVTETPTIKQRFGDLIQDLVDWGWL